MRFDRMGRRVEYIETVRDDATGSVVTNKHQKFVYDGYLCIQRLNGANNAVTDLFEWDPTEPIATRPLFWQPRTAEGNFSLFYTHDGNKNVSEVVFYQRARGVAAHYEYAPFGEVTVQTRGNAWGSLDLSVLNPWRFSSEYADDASATVYYNYRHYNSYFGRWFCRDKASELDIYLFCQNSPEMFVDKLGLHNIVLTIKENPEHQASLRFLANNSQKGDIKWGSTTALLLSPVELSEGDPIYDPICRTCLYIESLGAPSYSGRIEFVLNLVHEGDVYFDYDIDREFANQVLQHENKHVAIARGLLSVFSSAEANISKLKARGVDRNSCFLSLKDQVDRIDRETKQKYINLESKISRKLDRTESVGFKSTGWWFWSKQHPVVRGNFDVESALRQEGF